MRKFRFALNILAITVFSLAISSVAQAQATRTWVSGVGDDANPCSRTAPCKTFAGAISKTAAQGEINVLDPGGFGAVTITKSITISSECFEAGVLVSGTNGIVVAAQPGDKVKLRGLDINGLTTGLSAIKWLSGAQLTVENCWIYEFAQGIDVQSTTGGNLYVKDTRITQITGDAIHLQTSAGFMVANIDNVKLEGNSNGVNATPNSFGNISRSSIFQNGTNGLLTSTGATMNVESCVISHNGTGVNAATGSAFRLSNATIFNNGTGILAAGTAVVEGFFNNRVFGNATNGAVTHQTAQQ